MNRTRFISMLLACALLAWPHSAQAAPRATWPHSAQAARVAKSSCQPPAKPRGVRLSVLSSFSVTNSSDGLGDNDVEVYGYLHLDGQSAWRVARADAISVGGASIQRSRTVRGSKLTFDVIFDDSETWGLKIKGRMHDRDKGSNNDGMWNPYAIGHSINLKVMYDKFYGRASEKVRKLNPSERYVWEGDGESESANLILIIQRVEDIF